MTADAESVHPFLMKVLWEVWVDSNGLEFMSPPTKMESFVLLSELSCLLMVSADSVFVFWVAMFAVCAETA